MQTNQGPDAAFLNRWAGATQERNLSSVPISGQFAISSVTRQLSPDVPMLTTGLANHN